MGRQINFFMIGDDEAEFIDFIHSQSDAIFDRFGKIMTKEEVIQEERFGQVYIKLPQSIIKMKNYSRIDYFASNVIEFDRSKIKDKRVAVGRLYVEFIGYDEYGNKFRKEKWLEDKYNIYKKWIIQNCRINRDKDRYIGKVTYGLYKDEGYKMVGSLNDFESIPGEEFD